ncbi:MAG: RNA polymerase sigma factor, partial [Planctomycetota bacterium]
MTDGESRTRAGAASDSSLLAEFAERSSESALAELISRYQDLVYSTCRRVLGDAHAAEDAAQATFLVLVRKARSLRREGSLMGWLFRTAELVARNTRRARARAARRESEAVAMRKDTGSGGASWEEVRPELDAALVSLPRAQCDAVVMHYMGHMSHEEIARQLGCPRTTISARISGGLARLRAKLLRRGVSLPVAALGGMLSGQAVVSAPAGLAASVQAVCLGNAAASSTVAAATKGTIGAMAWAKAKVVAVVIGCAAAAGAGGTVAARGLAPEIVAAPAPGGPVLLGEDSFLRCQVIQMTDQV